MLHVFLNGLDMQLLSRNKLRQILDCSDNTITKLIQNENFPLPIGQLTAAENSPWKWDEEAVVQWLRSHMPSPTQQRGTSDDE